MGTDYAGLGVGRYPAGSAASHPSSDDHPSPSELIIHPYLSSPSAALDILYSVAAARFAFPPLSTDFVVVGHSQGGGATWAVAERLAVSNPVPSLRCRGCVPIAPATSVLSEPEPFRSIMFTAMTIGLKAQFPDVDLRTVLTDEGLRRLQLIRDSEAGVATCVTLLSGAELLRPGFENEPWVKEYAELVNVGGRRVGCPVLVVHGTADDHLDIGVVRGAVERTWEVDEERRLEFVTLPGVAHTPAVTASQRVYMEWIADRFAGKVIADDIKAGAGKERTLQPARPANAYAKEQNWYLEAATEGWMAP